MKAVSNEEFSSDATLTTFPVVSIAIDSIDPGAFQNIRTYDPKSIAGLAASIKANGLDTPLLLASAGDSSKFGIVAGGRRWAAIQKLIADGAEITEVAAKIVPGDVKNRLIKANTENNQRENMNYIQIATNIKAMQEQGMKLSEISVVVNHPVSWCSNAVSLLKLRDTVQSKISAGDVPWRIAKILPSLSEEEQDKLLTDLEAIQSGKSTETATEAADRATRTRKKKSGRGRKAKEEAEGGPDKPLTGKKSLVLLDEQITALKTAGEGEEVTEAQKQAAAVLMLFKKFMGSKLGPQALAKRLVKYAAGEGI